MNVRSETETIGDAGRPAARAAARLLALSARKMLDDAEKILTTAGDASAASAAREAGEATTRVLVATHDGPKQVFACKR